MPKNGHAASIGIKETKEIGERVRFLRKKAGLTIKELADIINVSYNTMGYIELGAKEGKPHFIKLRDQVNICKFFNISSDYLLFNLSSLNKERSLKQSELILQENSQLKKEIGNHKQKIEFLQDHIKTLKQFKDIK
jgi:transcriptional regulator with XRE-family HTH domain